MSEINKTVSQKKDLKEVATLFFKLGCIAFGGPAAHIAMMEDEVVTKRKWMTQEHFLDLVGATNLIPGPNSTEMTMHCGHERAGWKGLFVAGICFIFPAALITGVFAWLYQEYGQLPDINPFIYGIKPAVISIILMAAYKLSKKAIKSKLLALLCILAIIACLFGVNEIIVLFGAAILGVLLFFIKRNNNYLNSIIPLFIMQFSTETKVSTLSVFLVFLKIGAILYGSGYVLFAFLDSELVANGWLTKQVLLDAIAVGQITPGPILTTATFIGWQMNGFLGALAATFGIFLPSFLLVLILNPLIPKMRKSKVIGNILDTVNVAAVALIIAVCLEMAKNTITDWRTTLIAIVSLLIVFLFKKLNSAFIVLGSSFLGYLLTFI
ncbi:chromate transporter [Tenacibaculum sp. MAR_2010_89]|uniref:chromate efflux transporter n=1 Tax=Tenacibaculum sp. MAR_2010_89 TaxID=1250198 RepID=UPI000897B44B|nr:chromate efflux transporter [Tenacibaculum sp. MAR_2010_89]SEE42182.1 chromate transporter [Tenacibaculum sp. MAR_2010_89]